MKKKIMPLEKFDVAKLNGEELTLLAKFSSSKELEVLTKLAQESKMRRAFEAMEMDDLKNIATLSGVNIGVDFILDAAQRAKEELKNRGDKEFDSEE